MHGLHLGVHRPILDGLRAVLLLSQNQNQSEIDKIAVCCCGNDNPSNNISKAVEQLTELILPSRRTGPQHGQEITVCYILGGKSEVLLWLPHAKRHMPKGWSNVCCDYVCRVPRPGWTKQCRNKASFSLAHVKDTKNHIFRHAEQRLCQTRPRHFLTPTSHHKQSPTLAPPHRVRRRFQ